MRHSSQDACSWHVFAHEPDPLEGEPQGALGEFVMKTVTLKLPVLGFVVGTRAALAFGAGLLLAGRIPERRRRAIGMTMVAIGAASTIPAVMSIRRHVSD